MKETFDITGMTCAACSARVGKAASGVAGVEEANVNLLKNSMELVYDGEASTVDAVVAAIERAGGEKLEMLCFDSDHAFNADRSAVRAAVCDFFLRQL